MLIFTAFFNSELKNDDTLQEKAIRESGLSLTDFTLSNFTYKNNIIQEVMLRNLYNTSFIGVTVSSKEYSVSMQPVRLLVLCVCMYMYMCQLPNMKAIVFWSFPLDLGLRS